MAQTQGKQMTHDLTVHNIVNTSHDPEEIAEAARLHYFKITGRYNDRESANVFALGYVAQALATANKERK
jgi:hypothetical protein